MVAFLETGDGMARPYKWSESDAKKKS